MAVSKRTEKSVTEISSKLASLLTPASAESSEQVSETVSDLINTLSKEYADDMSITLIASSKIGKMLTKVTKSKTLSTDAKDKARAVIVKLKNAADKERAVLAEEKRQSTGPSSGPDATPQPPRTVKEYHRRLVDQNKELYKNPPVMAVLKVKVRRNEERSDSKSSKHLFAQLITFCSLLRSWQVSSKTGAPPVRDGDKGTFTFRDYPNFQPNRSPEEVLRGGAFGGTYFRPIVSAVTNIKYTGAEAVSTSCAPEWVKGVEKRLLTSSTYNASVNRWAAKCGGSLGMWESSGWISDVDPYGWFQWYCRFFQGRRTDDDDRQVKRWSALAGQKGRFRNQLIKKIINSGEPIGSAKVSPVVRQTLWHWGLEIDDEKIETYKVLKGLK